MTRGLAYLLAGLALASLQSCATVHYLEQPTPSREVASSAFPAAAAAPAGEPAESPWPADETGRSPRSRWEQDRTRFAARWAHAARPRIAVVGGASFLASEGDWKVSERFVRVADVHRATRGDSSFRGLSFVEQSSGASRSPVPARGPGLQLWERTLSEAGAVAVDADYVRRILASDREAWNSGRDLSLRALMAHTDYLLLVDVQDDAGSPLGYQLTARLLDSGDGRVLGSTSTELYHDQLASHRRVAVAGSSGYEFVEESAALAELDVVRLLSTDLLDGLQPAAAARH